MFRILTLWLDLIILWNYCILHAIHTSMTTVIKGSARSFKIGRGCRQGGLESHGFSTSFLIPLVELFLKKWFPNLAMGADLIWSTIYQFKPETGLKGASFEVGETQIIQSYECRWPVRVFHFCWSCEARSCDNWTGIQALWAGINKTKNRNDGHLANKNSNLSPDDDKIKNVLEFKYVRVMLSPSATPKFYEMKKVPTSGVSRRIQGDGIWVLS